MERENIIRAVPSGCGSLCGALPQHVERVTGADGREFLIFGDEAKPKIEGEEITYADVVAAAGNFIADIELSHEELQELEEHGVVVRSDGSAFAMWKVERKTGRRFLKRVE